MGEKDEKKVANLNATTKLEIALVRRGRATREGGREGKREKRERERSGRRTVSRLLAADRYA